MKKQTGKTAAGKREAAAAIDAEIEALNAQIAAKKTEKKNLLIEAEKLDEAEEFQLFLALKKAGKLPALTQGEVMS